MSSSGRYSLCIMVVLMLALGCSSATEPGLTFLATIEVGEGEDAEVVVPSEATVGTAFEVTFVTYVVRGCEEGVAPETEVSGLQARITPFTRRSTVRNCLDQFEKARQTARLTFSQVGEAMVVVRGLSDITMDTIEVTRMVEVR